jgi:hypothetical protein
LTDFIQQRLLFMDVCIQIITRSFGSSREREKLWSHTWFLDGWLDAMDIGAF